MRPIPLAPPVTRATLPRTENSSLIDNDIRVSLSRSDKPVVGRGGLGEREQRVEGAGVRCRPLPADQQTLERPQRAEPELLSPAGHRANVLSGRPRPALRQREPELHRGSMTSPGVGGRTSTTAASRNRTGYAAPAWRRRSA